MVISIGCMKRSTRAIPMSSDGFPIVREDCPGWVGKLSPSCPLFHNSVQSVYAICGCPILLLGLKQKQAKNTRSVRLFLTILACLG
jgi:hypothetical protein